MLSHQTGLDMHFKSVLLISLTLMGFVTLAEAGSTVSKCLKNNVQGQRAVDDANSKENPFLELGNPRTLNCDGETMTVECIKGPLLSNELRQWIANLVETNMKELYRNTPWGWNLQDKMKNITANIARLLIVRTASGNPVGFAHFRFRLERKRKAEVVHCWELQVEESMRGRGIGTYLLNLQTDLAARFNMRKTILTVFRANRRTYDLYTRVGFSMDETSPKNTFYLILSKPNGSFREQLLH